VASERAARHVLVCLRVLQAPYAVGAHADHAVAVAYRVTRGLDPNGGVGYRNGPNAWGSRSRQVSRSVLRSTLRRVDMCQRSSGLATGPREACLRYDRQVQAKRSQPCGLLVVQRGRAGNPGSERTASASTFMSSGSIPIKLGMWMNE
jgi:hypothetical protein